MLLLWLLLMVTWVVLQCGIVAFPACIKLVLPRLFEEKERTYILWLSVVRDAEFIVGIS